MSTRKVDLVDVETSGAAAPSASNPLLPSNGVTLLEYDVTVPPGPGLISVNPLLNPDAFGQVLPPGLVKSASSAWFQVASGVGVDNVVQTLNAGAAGSPLTAYNVTLNHSGAGGTGKLFVLYRNRPL